MRLRQELNHPSPVLAMPLLREGPYSNHYTCGFTFSELETSLFKALI